MITDRDLCAIGGIPRDARAHGAFLHTSSGGFNVYPGGAKSWLDLWDIDGTIPSWEGYK